MICKQDPVRRTFTPGLVAIWLVAAAGSGYWAQQTPQTVQTVIVLDFENRTGQASNDYLARLATDGVAVELANSGKFEVLKRAEVERTAKELNFKPPYDFIAKSKMAASLGASAIVEGSLDFVKEGVEKVDKKETRVVQVGLKVLVREPSSGELIGGATAIGEKAYQVKDKAAHVSSSLVAGAARIAVQKASTVKLIHGVIISSVGLLPKGVDTLINVGEKDGVTKGMYFVVLRDGKRVARIQVGETFPTDSEVRIVEPGMGIRPEDSVRELFEEPHYQTGPGQLRYVDHS